MMQICEKFMALKEESKKWGGMKWKIQQIYLENLSRCELTRLTSFGLLI